MCFYGHSHDYIIPHTWSDNGGKCCENMVCISAPTYRLAAASRTEDAMRGFNIIEMANEPGNRFDSISVKNYEVVKADIVLKNKNHLVCSNIKNGSHCGGVSLYRMV